MAQDSRTQLFFIFCVLFGVGFVDCQEAKKEYAEIGKSFTFKPNVEAEITMIAWKFTQKPGDVIKLVDWDPHTSVYWYSHQYRATLTAENGELTINKMTKEDNGLYEVELEVDGVLRIFKYELTVMDGVSIPQVTCELKNNAIDLGCSVNPPVKAEFTWTGPDGAAQGERFSIPEGQSKESIYFCTAKNEVSEQTTEWELAQCYKDGVSIPQVTCELKNNAIELVCSVKPPVKAEFTWTGPDGEAQGERFSIPEGQSKESIYFCTAKNEVSEQTTEWKLAQCYKESNVGSMSGPSIFGIIFGVIVFFVCLD